ncbi:uncharacterized protein [Halyomorpha halys]|uniref:uncharacterized protein n=1 Tax=Halyomorpha halys TaxID=286706 RepID=UPI0006D50914|nr:uncharacterized protein LOC106688005 [Halyomorpha halys]XP_014287750.1 uncharacterized protein LOC106688005 [Halyomorpha halys]
MDDRRRAIILAAGSVVVVAGYLLLQQLNRRRKRKARSIRQLSELRTRTGTFNCPKKKRRLFMKKNNEFKKESEDQNLVNDPAKASHFEEDESYETSKNVDISIKVEPGLSDDIHQDDVSEEDSKDFLAGSSRVKEESDPDSTIDVDNTIYIKQEDENDPNSPHTAVKIKIDPGLSDD